MDECEWMDKGVHEWVRVWTDEYMAENVDG